MPLDLKYVYDHPANVIDAEVQDDRDLVARTFAVLREYEAHNGVTFAALSNESLAALREAYTETGLDRGIGGLSGDAWGDLRDAVRDLLGLADD